jgi:hypothetical protein
MTEGGVTCMDESPEEVSDPRVVVEESEGRGR